MPAPFAYVKTDHEAGSLSSLRAYERHARREDHTSEARQREGAVKGQALILPNGSGRGYVANHRALLDARGAVVRKNAKRFSAHLVGVSRNWIEEAGDVHDGRNPRNVALIREAYRWANSWSNNGCFAARMDLDERGAGVVDVLVAPIMRETRKGGRQVTVVSTNKALEALSLEYCGRKGSHYAALNTSWHQWASLHLDPALQRGIPKKQTGRRHVPPDEYRAKLQLNQSRENLLERIDDIRKWADDLNTWEERLAREQDELAQMKKALQEMVADILEMREKLGKKDLERLEDIAKIVM